MQHTQVNQAGRWVGSPATQISRTVEVFLLLIQISWWITHMWHHKLFSNLSFIVTHCLVFKCFRAGCWHRNRSVRKRLQPLIDRKLNFLVYQCDGSTGDCSVLFPTATIGLLYSLGSFLLYHWLKWMISHLLDYEWAQYGAFWSYLDEWFEQILVQLDGCI